jgi:hypothetical protein
MNGCLLNRAIAVTTERRNCAEQSDDADTKIKLLMFQWPFFDHPTFGIFNAAHHYE